MVELMNRLGVDAATLGNHELDFGKSVLEARVAESTFPWLSANLGDAATGGPFDKVRRTPFVREVEFVDSTGAAATAKVCAFGVAYDVRVSISDKFASEVSYTDYLQAAIQQAAALKGDGCDVVVALTHLDQKDDCLLANQATGVDVVLGGHDHETTLVTSCGAPIFKGASDLKTAWVIELSLDDDSAVTGAGHVSAKSLMLEQSTPSDAAVAAVVSDWNARLRSQLGQRIGCTAVPLDAQRLTVRQAESNVGNLFTDALRSKYGVDVAVWNGGGIRGDDVLPAGDLTKLDLSGLHPFGNKVVTVTTTGADLRLYLEDCLSCYQDICGAFPQVSGIRYAFDPALPAGSRLRAFALADGTAIADDRVLTLAMSDYGFGHAEALEGATLLNMHQLSDALPFMEYTVYPTVEAAGTACIAPQVDGRITKLV